jgi:hypothetical protein
VFVVLKGHKKACKALDALARGKAALDEKYASELGKLVSAFGMPKDLPGVSSAYEAIIQNLRATIDEHKNLARDLFDYVSAPMANANQYMKKQMSNVL